MKVRRHEGSDIKRVLAGMVTDQTVCSRIASQWKDGGLFDSQYANMVGGWCIDYMRKYGEVPNGQLKSIFETWSEKADRPDVVVDGVERFLVHLSDEYSAESPQSSKYLLDVAGNLFEKVRLKKLSDGIDEELESGRVQAAHDLVAGASRIELGVGETVKLHEDYDAWREAFDPDQEEQLIRYQGRLDAFLGQQMVREGFVAFMGPDKSGKSFLLQDAAFRGVKARRRVAYFEAGDLGKKGVMHRLGSRAARIPHKPPLRIKMPVSINSDGKTVHQIKRFDSLLGQQQAYKAWRKSCRGKDLFRLSCFPNDTLSMERVNSILWDWEREGWVADIVVIDYADILAPVGGQDTLDQIDSIWKHMRRLSQELHGLVVTATQSSALAYSGKQQVLSRRHFSGRKTKLAHVTVMYGINQTPEEEKNGVIRLNKVVCREGASNGTRVIRVAGCLAIASPTMKVEDSRQKTEE